MAPQESNTEVPFKENGFRTYPTNRDVFMLHKSSKTWIEGKVIDDNLGGPYWRIHDKLYDLSSFADKHPGGKMKDFIYPRNLVKIYE